MIPIKEYMELGNKVIQRMTEMHHVAETPEDKRVLFWRNQASYLSEDMKFMDDYGIIQFLEFSRDLIELIAYDDRISVCSTPCFLFRNRAYNTVTMKCEDAFDWYKTFFYSPNTRRILTETTNEHTKIVLYTANIQKIVDPTFREKIRRTVRYAKFMSPENKDIFENIDAHCAVIETSLVDKPEVYTDPYHKRVLMWKHQLEWLNYGNTDHIEGSDEGNFRAGEYEIFKNMFEPMIDRIATDNSIGVCDAPSFMWDGTRHHTASQKMWPNLDWFNKYASNINYKKRKVLIEQCVNENLDVVVHSMSATGVIYNPDNFEPRYGCIIRHRKLINKQ